MTSTEMIAAVRAKEELAAEKERVKIEKKREKVEVQLMSLHDRKKTMHGRSIGSNSTITSRKARKVTKQHQKSITITSVAIV
jgi:hypothetical protein